MKINKNFNFNKLTNMYIVNEIKYTMFSLISKNEIKELIEYINFEKELLNTFKKKYLYKDSLNEISISIINDLEIKKNDDTKKEINLKYIKIKFTIFTKKGFIDILELLFDNELQIKKQKTIYDNSFNSSYPIENNIFNAQKTLEILIFKIQTLLINRITCKNDNIFENYKKIFIKKNYLNQKLLENIKNDKEYSLIENKILNDIKNEFKFDTKNFELYFNFSNNGYISINNIIQKGIDVDKLNIDEFYIENSNIEMLNFEFSINFYLKNKNNSYILNDVSFIPLFIVSFKSKDSKKEIEYTYSIMENEKYFNSNTIKKFTSNKIIKPLLNNIIQRHLNVI